MMALGWVGGSQITSDSPTARPSASLRVRPSPATTASWTWPP